MWLLIACYLGAEVKKRLREGVLQGVEVTLVTTEIQKELFQQMGVDGRRLAQRPRHECIPSVAFDASM